MVHVLGLLWLRGRYQLDPFAPFALKGHHLRRGIAMRLSSCHHVPPEPQQGQLGLFTGQFACVPYQIQTLSSAARLASPSWWGAEAALLATWLKWVSATERSLSLAAGLAQPRSQRKSDRSLVHCRRSPPPRPTQTSFISLQSRSRLPRASAHARSGSLLSVSSAPRRHAGSFVITDY